MIRDLDNNEITDYTESRFSGIIKDGKFISSTKIIVDGHITKNNVEVFIQRHKDKELNYVFKMDGISIPCVIKSLYPEGFYIDTDVLCDFTREGGSFGKKYYKKVRYSDDFELYVE